MSNVYKRAIIVVMFAILRTNAMDQGSFFKELYKELYVASMQHRKKRKRVIERMETYAYLCDPSGDFERYILEIEDYSYNQLVACKLRKTIQHMEPKT